MAAREDGGGMRAMPQTLHRPGPAQPGRARPSPREGAWRYSAKLARHGCFDAQHTEQAWFNALQGSGAAPAVLMRE